MIQNGYSQREIAKALNISQSTVSRLANADPATFNDLLAFMQIARMPPGPGRDAALESARRDRLGDTEYERQKAEQAEYESFRHDHHCRKCETDSYVRELHARISGE